MGLRRVFSRRPDGGVLLWLKRPDHKNYIEDEADADAADESSEVGHVLAADPRTRPGASVVELLDDHPAVPVVGAPRGPEALRLVAPPPPRLAAACE